MTTQTPPSAAANEAMDVAQDLEQRALIVSDKLGRAWNVLEPVDETARHIQAAIDKATAPLEARLAASEAMCDQLAEALKFIELHDISHKVAGTIDAFNYGGEHPNLGVHPNAGSRWATPRELAKDALTAYTAHKEGR